MSSFNVPLSKRPEVSVSAKALASMIRLGSAEALAGPVWSEGDLAAILQHQLTSPLAEEMKTMIQGENHAVAQAMKIDRLMQAEPAPLHSMRDLLLAKAPPLELLVMVKDFAKTSRSRGALPAEVASVVYFAAILVARLRHHRSITNLPETSVRKGVQWVLARKWLDGELRKLLEDGERLEFAAHRGGKRRSGSPKL
jgi:hypothetical protein